MMADFSGLFGVVTGAASGIGLAVAEALRAGGAEVLGIDRAEVPGCRAVDLALPGAGAAVLCETQGRDADFLVNAAAVFHSAPVDQTGADDWDRLFAVNLRAPFLLTRALAPGLARRRGAVVNISSVNAIRVARNNIVYDSLKAGLDHMTRGLALDLGPQGIRVNAVAPGGTGTPGLADWLARAQARETPDAAEIAALVAAEGLATPERIADVVLFLLSPASVWVNGAVILADNAAYLRS